MRAILTAALAAIAAMIVFVLYERISGNGSVGPSAMLGIAFLATVFALLLATLLSLGTRFGAGMINMWIVLFSLSSTYLLVDIAAGRLLITPLSPPLKPDEHRHHVLVPNTISYFEQRDFSYIQRVNNVGLRGRDLEANKSSQEYRILMLGDSFTMGKGVQDDQTFSVLLQESLRLNRPSGMSKTIQVLNAGVDSYAPLLSYLQLTRDLVALEPDMVVLNFDNSDLLQEAVYRKEAVYGTDGEILRVPGRASRQSLSEKMRVWTEQNLYLTRLILYHINKLFEYRDLTVQNMVTHANLELISHTLVQDAVQREQQWEDVFDSILKIGRYCKENNIEFLLTIYPWGHQVSATEWIPGRDLFMPRDAVASDKSASTLLEFAAKNNIKCLNLFPVFRSYAGTSKLYFSYDAHFTAAGHKLMASALSQYLKAFLSDGNSN